MIPGDTCARGFPVFLSAATCHPGKFPRYSPWWETAPYAGGPDGLPTDPAVHVPAGYTFGVEGAILSPHVEGSPSPWRLVGTKWERDPATHPETVTQAPGESPRADWGGLISVMDRYDGDCNGEWDEGVPF